MNQREGKALLRLSEKAIDAPRVYQILQPRLLAVRAVAILGKDANHCRSYGDCLIRPQQYAAVAGELLVSGNPAEQDAEIHSRRNVLSFTHFYCTEANVVGVRHHAD